MEIKSKNKTLIAFIDKYGKFYEAVIYDDALMLERKRLYKNKNRAIKETKKFLNKRKHLRK